MVCTGSLCELNRWCVLERRFVVKKMDRQEADPLEVRGGGLGVRGQAWSWPRSYMVMGLMGHQRP